MKTTKTCIDCLYCRVSRLSTENNRLYFCSQKKKTENHKEKYWLAKKACDEFVDMTKTKYSEQVFEKKLLLYPVPSNPLMIRRPLIRKSEKSASMPIFQIGVLQRKTPAKALETAASMPPKAGLYAYV